MATKTRLTWTQKNRLRNLIDEAITLVESDIERNAKAGGDAPENAFALKVDREYRDDLLAIKAFVNEVTE